MPKKDTASAVLGMLSTAGAQTRVADSADPPPPVEQPAPRPAPEPVAVERAVGTRLTASVTALPPTNATSSADVAPRTLRLRPETAQQLRAAWLEAKRDDVLLTAQDFASTLVDEALSRRRRSRAASSR
jgi:hypothetical protein